MNLTILWGSLIPLLGTTLGAACVFLLQGEIGPRVQKGLLGFASGVMVAASVWSLLIPAIDQCSRMGRLAFLPPVIGFLLGIGFLLILDQVVPHQHLDSDCPEGTPGRAKGSTMLMLAVTLHNIPEGMAVGVVLAGLRGSGAISARGRHGPVRGHRHSEPARGSRDLHALEGSPGKKKAFLYGVLSGVVEPIGALLTVALAGLLVPLMPYFLSFAAGAMLYVVVEELIPESAEGAHSNVGTITFAIGFAVMMILDVALG